MILGTIGSTQVRGQEEEGVVIMGNNLVCTGEGQEEEGVVILGKGSNPGNNRVYTGEGTGGGRGSDPGK